jgi:putative ABC transport system permease protein
MFDSVKKGIRELFRNKLRIFLTIGGITIGVLSVVVISTIGEIGKATINKKMTSMGLDSVVVSTTVNGALYGLEESDLERLKSLDHVKKAIPLMSLVTYMKAQDNQDNCILWGVNEDANNVIDLNVLYGRLIHKSDVLTKSKVCVIDEELAKKTFNRTNIVGQEVNVSVYGVMQEYTVIGVVKNGVNMLQSMLGDAIPAFVYIPYTTYESETAKECFDQIAVKLKDSNTDITNDIKRTIKLNNNSNVKINVQNLLNQKDTLSGILDNVTIVLTFIAGISLVVSSLSIMTVMMVSVSERTREIGIKKVL